MSGKFHVIPKKMAAKGLRGSWFGVGSWKMFVKHFIWSWNISVGWLKSTLKVFRKYLQSVKRVPRESWKTFVKDSIVISGKPWWISGKC